MRWVLITIAVFAILCAVLFSRPAADGETIPWWGAALAFVIGMAFGARRLLLRHRR